MRAWHPRRSTARSACCLYPYASVSPLHFCSFLGVSVWKSSVLSTGTCLCRVSPLASGQVVCGFVLDPPPVSCYIFFPCAECFPPCRVKPASLTSACAVTLVCLVGLHSSSALHASANSCCALDAVTTQGLCTKPANLMVKMFFKICF